jgi:hypothetical protein
MPNRTCCICSGPLQGIGCRADPFNGGMCCNDCRDRFVDPVRVVLGSAATIGLLKILRAIAKEGRHMLEQRAISEAMLRVAHGLDDQLTDPPLDQPGEAIRDG